jgi:hypothetical protein
VRTPHADAASPWLILVGEKENPGSEHWKAEANAGQGCGSSGGGDVFVERQTAPALEARFGYDFGLPDQSRASGCEFHSFSSAHASPGRPGDCSSGSDIGTVG